MTTIATTPVHCSIHCRVIDNFGDAGVCWRLARQLADEFDWQVCLIIDAPELLARLEPQYCPYASPTICRSVTVLQWDDAGARDPEADVVIEAFGCQLPASVLTRLCGGSCDRPPVWINLEYLSAEDWVAGCHALPSPDPQTGALKHFFFPGFTPATGGLIRERRWPALIEAYAAPDARRNFLASLGVHLTAEEITISLFSYPDSPTEALYGLGHSGPRLHWLVPQSIRDDPAIHPLIATYPGRVSVLPFLPQDDYDLLLLSCDLNFVRGEDSFVRAQWAGRPFVWQAYRQDVDTRSTKIDAFLALYLKNADEQLSSGIRDFWGTWNGTRTLSADPWPIFLQHLKGIEAHNLAWRNSLFEAPDLASSLVAFCESRL